MRFFNVILSLPLFASMMIQASAFAQGGGMGGNGGDAIVCRDPAGSILSAELLDFYEARILRQIHVDLGSESTDYTEMMKTLIERLTRRSPNRGKVFADWYRTFESDSLFLSGVELADIPDSLHAAMPRGCRVEQVAIQEPPVRPEDKRYLISKDIWLRMPNSSKAGLILHELFFREAIETHARLGVREPLNSIDVRYLNALVASKRIENLTLKDWNALFQTSDFFRYIEIDGLDDLINGGSRDKLKVTYASDGASVEQWSYCCNFDGYDTFSGRKKVRYFDFLIGDDTLNNGLIMRNKGGMKSASFDQRYSLYSYQPVSKGVFELGFWARENPMNYINRLSLSPNGAIETLISRDHLSEPAMLYEEPSPNLNPRCRTWALKPSYGKLDATMNFSGEKGRLERITLRNSGGATVCGLEFPAVTPRFPITLEFDDRGGLTGDSPMSYFNASKFDLSEASTSGRYFAVSQTEVSLLGAKVSAKAGTELVRNDATKTFAFTTNEAFSICKNDKCRRGCTHYPPGSSVVISDKRSGAICR